MPDLSQEEFTQRIASLKAEVEKKLPEFAKACREGGAEALMLHQDAFAADYQEHEYTLLGMAIKFAGLCGKTVHIIGENRETLTKE